MSSSSGPASAAPSRRCGWPRRVIGVTVFESGRRFEDEEFAATSWDVRRYFWAPRLGCYGVQRIHKLPDVMLLAGAGVGGGSLNYANTLYVPPKAFFDDPQWSGITDWAAELAPHYDQAARMLGVVENPCEGPVEDDHAGGRRRPGRRAHLPQDAGRGLLRPRRTRRPASSGSEPGAWSTDPFFGGAGPARTGCTECGNCMVGCRVGAKNTLVEELPGARRTAGGPDRAAAHRRGRPAAGRRPTRGRASP